MTLVYISDLTAERFHRVMTTVYFETLTILYFNVFRQHYLVDVAFDLSDYIHKPSFQVEPSGFEHTPQRHTRPIYR